ncbi:hypothetical protein ACFVSS_15720 [Peribacillus butanolivorans]|uniref:hypothetical protein n=1 Tax=Peribacillus butanolivorans TaxID=421767 RepID=UPI0036DEC37A
MKKPRNSFLMLRIGFELAHIGIPEVLVGIIPGDGRTISLPLLVGHGVAAAISYF